MEFGNARQCDHLDKLHKWSDITSEFKESVKDLKMGELLHDQLFGLFEAMSAIEMMDPKMDAGMLCNRGARKAKTFAQSLEEGIVKVDNFENSVMIGVIDTTFACIVSWLEGHSLAQTVFTNLYLHQPYLIEDRVMKAFCLVVYKLLEIIGAFVYKAQVYEEEDFQPLQYGYKLNPDISEQRMIGMLREVEEELHRKSRPRQSLNEVQAVYARIKFTRVLYQSLILMRKEEQFNAIGDCQRLYVTAVEMLNIMISTIDLGIQADDKNELIPGFEPLINQRLLPPTFPRYTKIKPRKEALQYFMDMIERFKLIMKIHSITSLHQVIDFFVEFSKNSPCLLTRSALQLFYESTNPATLRDNLRESVKLFICPPSLVSKSILATAQSKKYIDSFLSHCTRPFAMLLQLCGHNRARQRDKLAHLLEDFTALQDEAERVDAYLHNISINETLSRAHLACFGTWILYHTLKIMIMYLLSGFELELYSKHEYYYIYWYLYEFLYGWLVSTLSRADSFLAENEIISELHRNKSGTSKKKTKHNKKKTKPYCRDIIYYQALQNMCGGYYKALMGFRLDGKLTMPHPQFDSEQVRYEHRFAPFQNLLTPPPVQYSDFRDMTSMERFQHQPVDSLHLYIIGYKHFHQARQLLENMTPDNEINDLLKIAKTNFIVLKLLAGGHRKDSTTPPEFDFTLSKYFPVIKLL